MFQIEKEFHFCAGHFLRDFDGPCSRQHGHNYIVVVALAGGELVGPGFVREFGELEPFKRFLDEHFDHRNLNDVRPFDVINPTTENLAKHLYHVAKVMFPEVVEVRVSETPKTWVSYAPVSFAPKSMEDDPYEF